MERQFDRMSFIDDWMEFFKGFLPPTLRPMEPLEIGHLLTVMLREIYSDTPIIGATVFVDGSTAQDLYGTGDYCVKLPTGTYTVHASHRDYHDAFLKGLLDQEMFASIRLDKRI